MDLKHSSTGVGSTPNLLLNLRSPRDYVVRSSVRPSVRRLFAPVVCVR